MWETLYPILVTDHYHFHIVYDLVHWCGFEFTEFRRRNKVYIIYLYNHEDFLFICELLKLLDEHI